MKKDPLITKLQEELGLSRQRIASKLSALRKGEEPIPRKWADGMMKVFECRDCADLLAIFPKSWFAGEGKPKRKAAGEIVRGNKPILEMEVLLKKSKSVVSPDQIWGICKLLDGLNKIGIHLEMKVRYIEPNK
jgi:hypothetical protein